MDIDKEIYFLFRSVNWGEGNNNSARYVKCVQCWSTIRLFCRKYLWSELSPLMITIFLLRIRYGILSLNII